MSKTKIGRPKKKKIDQARPKTISLSPKAWAVLQTVQGETSRLISMLVESCSPDDIKNYNQAHD